MLLHIMFYAAGVIVAILVLGSLVTFPVERSPYHKEFIAGRAPGPLPDGFYPGLAHADRAAIDSSDGRERECAFREIYESVRGFKARSRRRKDAKQGSG